MRPLAAVLAALAVALPPPAAASVADLFGVGSAGIASGDAAVASASDFSACHYNPAGLAAGNRAGVSLGYTIADSRLRVGGDPLELDHAGGVVAGLALPIDLPWTWLSRLTLGLAAYVPPDVVLSVHGRPADEPAVPFYENRLARWMLVPALALRLPAGVALGAGVDLFVGVRGPVSAYEGPTGAVEARSSQEVHTVAAPIVGLRWDPLDWLSLGLTWRGEFASPVAARYEARAGGADLAIAVAMDAFYRPDTLVLGLAFQGDSWRAEADLSWAHWSAYEHPLFDVQADLQGLRLTPSVQPVEFQDGFGLKLGGEWRTPAGPAQLALRAGYGYESAILADAPSAVALVDSPRHRISGGLGISWTSEAGTRLALDVHLAAHVLESTEHRVLVPADPGAEFEVGLAGTVLSAGAALAVEFSP